MCRWVDAHPDVNTARTDIPVRRGIPMVLFRSLKCEGRDALAPEPVRESPGEKFLHGPFKPVPLHNVLAISFS